MLKALHKFETVDEFLRAAWNTKHRNNESFSSRFHAVTSEREARALAVAGDHSTAAKIHEIRATIDQAIPHHPTRGTVHSLDIEGGDVSITDYLTGDPECMIRYEQDEPTKGRFITLVVNISAAAGNKSSLIINRGAAAVAIVDELESRGYRVEILCTCFFSPQKHSRKDYGILITLKKHDEHLSNEILAYWLAHPSALRVHMFQCMGALHAHEEDSFTPNGGMGYPCEHYPAELPENSIYMEGLTYGGKAAKIFNDTATTAAYAVKQIERMTEQE